jgi:hypothetical protein
MMLYVLGGREGRTPISEPDTLRWAMWYEEADRCVAQTGNGDRLVSTVFLGLDHNYGRARGGPPRLFETLVFGGEHDRVGTRYSTWDEAEAEHRRHCELVFGKAFAEAS